MREIDAIVCKVKRLGFEPIGGHIAQNYASLPLCIVDSVFSIGVKYTGVVNTIQRFCTRHGWSIGPRDRYSETRGERTTEDFLRLFEETPGDETEIADSLFSNQQRTSTRSGILKSEACRRFADALLASEINDFVDITTDRLDLAEARILMIPGQGSGLSFDYFRLLAGDDAMVKPDRMVVRFVAGVLQVKPDAISPRFAAQIIRLAAKDLKKSDKFWTPMKLDYQIWKYQKELKQGA